ncbi:MAG TPA: hypothetical protein VL995_02770 [Cellvibrio sp.]|nr:hypothetical protein [Cellvibrio sp.]
MKANYSLIITMSVLLLQACATPPPVVIDQVSLENAATHTLKETVYFSTIFSTCAALGGDVEVEAISKQQDWLNANTNLSLAADQYYSQQQAANTFEYQGKTLAPAAIKLALDAKQRAVNELGLNQRTPANKIKTCEFRLGKMTGSTIDLAQDPLITPYASELLTHLPLDKHIENIPKLAGGIDEVAPGQTYYQLVKTHEASCSSSAFTLSIVNQSPKEVYANFCGDKAVEVLTCEWGKCESKKL